METLTFTATSQYGQSGQYVAQLTGRAPRVRFQREFLGRKTGKRGDETRATIEGPGLYTIVHKTRKGPDENFRAVMLRPAGMDDEKLKSDDYVRSFTEDLISIVLSEDEALALAKALDEGKTMDDFEIVETPSGMEVRVAEVPVDPAAKALEQINAILDRLSSEHREAVLGSLRS